MCLNTLSPIKEKSGYGIKVVKATDKADEFGPFYPYFDIRGRGGRGYSTQRQRPDEVIAARVVYKIGRTYRVKHNRQARTDHMHLAYPALVHCYSSLEAARRDHGLPTGKHVFLLVKYSGGQYTDGQSFTAKYVTPIAKLDEKTYTKFKSLVAAKGFKIAAEALELATTFYKEEK